MASAAERMMNQRKLDHQREIADLNGNLRSEALAAQREKHALSMQVLEMQGKLQAVERERDAAVEESMDKGVESEERLPSSSRSKRRNSSLRRLHGMRSERGSSRTGKML